MRRAVVVVLVCLLAALTPRGAAAHQRGQSYIFLRVYADSIVVRVELAVDDLDRVLRLGWSSERGVTREQIHARVHELLAYVRPRLHIAAGGRELPLRFTGDSLRDFNLADYALLQFVIDGVRPLPERLEVGFPVFFEVNPDHRNLVVIEHDWSTGTFNAESNVALILSPASPRQSLSLASRSTLRGFLAFIRLGTWHIWNGIDHILFLLTLILPSVLRRRRGEWEPVPTFRSALGNVLVIVTCFTVAHTITLSLAALGVVRLPERLVEAVIALSIAAAALYNLFPRAKVREWMIALAFGLFHGFGFATVLGEIDIERKYLVLSLLGFNLGVELGQVAVICLIVPLLFLLRMRRAYVPMLRYASVLMVAVALLWFAQRAFEVPISSYVLRAPGYAYRHLFAHG